MLIVDIIIIIIIICIYFIAYCSAGLSSHMMWNPSSWELSH